MADGLTLNAGSGGATLATDEIGSTHYQIVKVSFGALETATLVSASDPLPVAGAVTNAGTFAVQAAQSGTWNVTNISGTVSLPTGAATAAKQPALGTAGTASTDVLTVQGIASMTALKVDGSAVAQPVTDNSGSLTVDAPVGTPVFVRLSDGSSAIATLPVSLASVPSHAVTNAGTFAVQVDGSALTALQKIDDPVFVDDAAFTPATSSVMAAGFIADEGSTDSVDEGDVGAARMTLDRKVHVAAELESNAMRAGGTAVTPKFAVIDAATSGDNTLVAAVNPKKLRVLAAFLVSAGTVNVRFESGAGGTALTGQMNLVANTGFVLPYNPVGWFETASNTLLNLELSGAVSVDGSLTYIEV